MKIQEKRYLGERKTVFRSIKNQFQKVVNRTILTKKSGVKEYTGSGARKCVKSLSYTYFLTSNINDKKWKCLRHSFYDGNKFRKEIEITFKKPQLKGKLIRMYGRMWRIVA